MGIRFAIVGATVVDSVGAEAGFRVGNRLDSVVGPKLDGINGSC